MRIAVSGTHGVGKSTLIDEFLREHPEFVREPEPYTVLVEDLGEEFGEEPCVEDLQRQLEFNIERLDQHAAGTNVIYERCPLDFLAYIDALDQRTTETIVGPVRNALQHLELIVYLPLDSTTRLADEYPKLQKAVDRRLSMIFREDEFGIITSSNLVVVEATGPTGKRLRLVEDAIRSLKASRP